MSGLFRKLSLLTSVALAGSAWASQAPQGREIINVFPVQNWAAISQVAPTSKPDRAASEQETVPMQSAPSVPERAVQPFELLGELRENHTSVFVVGATASDETFIVCGKGCKIEGAILPGQEFAGGYRVKKFSPAGLQILAGDGVVYELPVTGLGQ